MKTKPNHRQPTQEELQINHLIFANIQLSRFIWSILQATGGKATIDPNAVPMLWNLKYTEAEGKLQVESRVLPDLEEDTLKVMAGKLLGTRKDITEPMKEMDLGSYPPHYIGVRLALYAVHDETGLWRLPKEVQQEVQERN